MAYGGDSYAGLTRKQTPETYSAACTGIVAGKMPLSLVPQKARPLRPMEGVARKVRRLVTDHWRLRRVRIHASG